MELLANKLRPKSLNDIIGQEHLVGKDKIIYNMVQNQKILMILLDSNIWLVKMHLYIILLKIIKYFL